MTNPTVATGTPSFILSIFRDTMSRAEVIPSILTPWNEVELDFFRKYWVPAYSTVIILKHRIRRGDWSDFA